MEAYLDCRCGISGHSALAALCHVGLDVGPLATVLHEAGVDCRLHVQQALCAGGPGCRVKVDCGSSPRSQRHESVEALCCPARMGEVLGRICVSEEVRHKALAALDALSSAEAHALSVTQEEVRFSEAEAVDVLVAVLGVPWGLAALGITRVTASPLPWCSGTVCRGGAELPLPRPATARLMEGKPLFTSAQQGALVTPLGAALVHVLAEDFQAGPQGVLWRMGTGYGVHAEGAGLRLWLMREAACADTAHGAGCLRREMVCMLESHVDHLSGEELGVAVQELSALPEVLDVLWLPGIGKKNRPAGALRVLCTPQHTAEVERAFFAHTHSLGVRCQHMERAVLPREACTLDTAVGPLRAKRYTVEGADYVRVECDALRAAAKEQQCPPLAVARGCLRRGVSVRDKNFS